MNRRSTCILVIILLLFATQYESHSQQAESKRQFYPKSISSVEYGIGMLTNSAYVYNHNVRRSHVNNTPILNNKYFLNFGLKGSFSILTATNCQLKSGDFRFNDVLSLSIQALVPLVVPFQQSSHSQLSRASSFDFNNFLGASTGVGIGVGYKGRVADHHLVACGILQRNLPYAEFCLGSRYKLQFSSEAAQFAVFYEHYNTYLGSNLNTGNEYYLRPSSMIGAELAFTTETFETFGIRFDRQSISEFRHEQVGRNPAVDAVYNFTFFGKLQY